MAAEALHRIYINVNVYVRNSLFRYQNTDLARIILLQVAYKVGIQTRFAEGYSLPFQYKKKA